MEPRRRAFPSAGRLRVTGTVGPMTRESANVAMTWVRSHAERLVGAARFDDTTDVHVHLAKGQGCGRGGCTSSPALDTRPAPRRDVLQPRRPERGDPRPPRRAQRPADEEAGHQPPRALRAARPSGPPAPAGHALRPRVLEALPRQHGLPHRRRAARLQRALPAPPRAGRGPLHHDDRRGLLQGPPRGVPSPPLRRTAVHRGRAHAQRPPRARRVDTVTPHPLGREGRTGNR